MVESNKVLSVSYGTFSCRLEGFDDSVETMKTVVAYFHELAGHDRFMDMEPQAPDLDELAELTIESGGTEVDATMDEGRVSLRVERPEQADVEEQPTSRIPLRVPKPVVVAAKPVVVEEQVGSFDDEEFAADIERPAEVEAAAEDITDELEPIAQDAADGSTDEVYEDEALDVEEIVEANGLDDMAEDLADEGDYAEESDQEPTLADDFEDEDYEDEDDTPYYEPAAQSPSPDADDSVAAKLERIRSLVGRTPPADHKPAANTDGAASIGAMARLSELTGTSQEDDASNDEVDEDLVDDFNFKSEEPAPLVLSNEDDLENDDDDLDDLDETAQASDFDDEAVDTATQDMGDVAAEDDDDLSADIAAAEADITTHQENLSKRGNFPDNDDDAMSRIMSQADERLNEPEGRRHRDAFAQLKAAVAATEAARQLGDGEGEKDPKDAFREDLDDAVNQGENSGRETVGSPLKLVAEHRIEDDEEAEPAAPADRLRQIAAVKEPDAGPTGFAEFAADHGATDLGDLLEAAAAYISFVEGDDDFSRPQVMKKVQSAAAEEFSREDGLRSFGRLLRQSRIVKLSNGRFQVAQDTRFRPAGQAAQG